MSAEIGAHSISMSELAEAERLLKSDHMIAWLKFHHHCQRHNWYGCLADHRLLHMLYKCQMPDGSYIAPHCSQERPSSLRISPHIEQSAFTSSESIDSEIDFGIVFSEDGGGVRAGIFRTEDDTISLILS